MTVFELEKLKYPIGNFKMPDDASENRQANIEVIKNLPKNLISEVENLSDEQLDTPYRKDGWTIRQVVHHLADSHMNAFIRFKLALTEDNPTIKPFEESLWADLADGKDLPIDSSLKIIEGLHFRWAILLNSLSEDQFQRTYFHPAQGKKWTLENVLALYSWHSSHHLAHITNLRNVRTGINPPLDRLF